MKKKIILYCGEFDPPHMGHVCTASLALNYMQTYDKVLFVPCGVDVVGLNSVASERHIKKMLSLMLAPLSDRYFSVADFTINMNNIKDLKNKVDLLKREYDPILLIELDQAQYIYRRRGYQELLKIVRFIVTNKKGHFKDPSNLLLREPNVFIKAYPYIETISLLSLRINSSKNIFDEVIDSDVADYITEKNFYNVLHRGK